MAKTKKIQKKTYKSKKKQKGGVPTINGFNENEYENDFLKTNNS